ncbi:MAG: hypothetical protein RRB13_11735 [bacterium]|nr:hypothetical protein [bacterium]
MSEGIKLNYEEMVAAYWDSLNTVLRGFNAQGEFLDLWVPDEDGVSSILNLLEAVQEKGHDQLELVVSQETVDSMDLALLQEELVSLGDVSITEQAGGIVLQVSGLAEGAAFHNVHPVYVSALRAAAKGTSYQGNVERVDAQAQAEGLTLTVSVDQGKHLLITQARWQGEAGPLEAAMLNATCQVLEGITLADASDHGVLRVEDFLRDEKLRRPTSGIVIPERVEPAFKLPLELMRGLLADYQKKDPKAGQVNFFVPAFSQHWEGLSDQERIGEVARAAEGFLRELKLAPDSLSIERIDSAGRVTVALKEELDVHFKGELLLKLERFLDKGMEPNLHLYMQELEDRNSKRRQILHKDDLEKETT